MMRKTLSPLWFNNSLCSAIKESASHSVIRKVISIGFLCPPYNYRDG
jgi:hypothetical protein